MSENTEPKIRRDLSVDLSNTSIFEKLIREFLAKYAVTDNVLITRSNGNAFKQEAPEKIRFHTWTGFTEDCSDKTDYRKHPAKVLGISSASRNNLDFKMPVLKSDKLIYTLRDPDSNLALIQVFRDTKDVTHIIFLWDVIYNLGCDRTEDIAKKAFDTLAERLPELFGQNSKIVQRKIAKLTEKHTELFERYQLHTDAAIQCKKQVDEADEELSSLKTLLVELNVTEKREKAEKLRKEAADAIAESKRKAKELRKEADELLASI